MVCVSTPDHTHFAATIAAMERKIHVFTQKPLVHNIWQTRTLKKAKDHYKVHTNMVKVSGPKISSLYQHSKLSARMKMSWV